MISSTPRQQPEKFKSFVATVAEPIYDTVNGEPVYIPVGYTVKITGKANTPGYYKIAVIQPRGVVRTVATAKQLGIEAKSNLTNLNNSVDETNSPNILTLENEYEEETSSVVPPQDGPLIPRIYQEYGITFLLYKGRAILADAPGVGKTLQALEASWRVMQALQRRLDPLALCYTNDLSNRHDELNTHPTERPDWAVAHESHKLSTYTYGKTTINVYTKIRSYYWPASSQPCTVIVAPNHLCTMWYKAIRAQYPDAYVALATGTGSTREERMSVITPGHHFIIVNYEMMRPTREPKETDYEYVDIDGPYGFKVRNKQLKASYKKPVTYLDKLEALQPVCIIFDESHNLKSTKSKQARACAEFAAGVQYRFLLTATPIKREADDLYMQLHIIDPDVFDGSHLNAFTYEYCFFNNSAYGKQNIQLRDSAKRRFWFNRIASLENADGELYATTTKKDNKKYNTSFTRPNINGYILGRSYKDVGLYLPTVIPANIPVEMDGNYRKIYDDIKRTYRATFEELGMDIDVNSMIAMIHHLRVMTACPNKYEAVKQLIDDNEGPFAIFCEYKVSGELLATMLGTTYITGEIPTEDREPLVARLLSEGKPIVGMGRVIGTGINAMADCNVIINFEADWTPGERTQRIGRVQRFSPNRVEGQPILLFDVFCTDTIDQHVYEVQRNRGISIRDIITVELGIK
jgi:superfamily II DNA or RNA helicase